MLEQDANKKKMLFFMRFVRIVSAALVAFALLYLINQKRMKNAAPSDTPQAEASPATESEPGPDNPLK